MKKLRKYISWLTVSIMVIGSVAGCGSSSGQADSAAAPEAVAESTAEAASEAAEPAAEEAASEAAEPAAEEAASAAEEPAADAAEAEDHSDWVRMDLTYASNLPEAHPSTEQLTRFVEKCNERMDGLVTITGYYSSSMLNSAGMYEGIVNDVCDMGFFTTSMCVGLFDCALLCDKMGFYYESGKASAAAMYDYYQWCAENTDEWKDVVPLTVLGLAPQGFATNHKLETLDDFKGLNCIGATSFADGLERWGMVQNTMEYSDIYEALRNGLMDAYCGTIGVFGNMGVQEILDYAYVCHLLGQANAIVINRDVFERMPESQQKLFMELWKEVQFEYVGLYLEDFTLGDDVMSQKYCKEVKHLESLSPELEAELLELVKDIPDQYAAELDAKGQPGTEALAYYRSVLDKYNKEYPQSMEGYLRWRE